MRFRFLRQLELSGLEFGFSSGIAVLQVPKRFEEGLGGFGTEVPEGFEQVLQGLRVICERCTNFTTVFYKVHNLDVLEECSVNRINFSRWNSTDNFSMLHSNKKKFDSHLHLILE